MKDREERGRSRGHKGHRESSGILVVTRPGVL